MFLFLKLYLAHLIADFILQFDELYNLKVKNQFGHILHVVIHFVVSLLLVIPYLKMPFIWIFIISMTIIHYFQDNLKYHLQKNPKIMFHCYFIDQIFHYVFLATIMLFPIGKMELGFTNAPRFNIYYANNYWTLLIILFILISFGTSYTLYNYRKTFANDARPDHYITSFEMVHAMVERTFIAAIFLFSPSPVWFAAAPLIGFLRFSSNKLKNLYDFVLSFTCAMMLGLLFRLWI